jgi:hypothetical protein
MAAAANATTDRIGAHLRRRELMLERCDASERVDVITGMRILWSHYTKVL